MSTDEAAPSQPTEPTSVPTEAPPPPAAPRFVGGPVRSRTVTLEYPLEYDGKLWTEITVRRASAGDVEAFVAAVQRGENPTLPMTDAPAAVLDALDADDFETVNKAINDFLPRALRDPGQ
ncbi:MAG: phage tail assembly protein [Beijerinckiaceae bacterium]